MLKKIKFTLHEAAEGLELLNGDFCIFGSSALILSGFPIRETRDIDILTTSENSDLLKKIWSDKLVITPKAKEISLFRSNLGLFKFAEMEIEVSGNLEIYKNNQWNKVTINEFNTIFLNGLSVKVPTLKEQIRILKFFGREKDMKRLEFIDGHSDNAD
jgi:hypothetical protein